MLIPTVKEVPADAEIPSHQLMLRAGIFRKLASGTYTYLPFGWRCLLKVINIVREEMNKSGAQEILMPSVQPIELWKQTGRDVDYGPTMARFEDRHGRENVLAPTAEEVVTSIAAGEINSYKQLPINLYQISFKFRDEFRPRFGVLRSREFIMKDAYSFHATPESLEETTGNVRDILPNFQTLRPRLRHRRSRIRRNGRLRLAPVHHPLPIRRRRHRIYRRQFLRRQYRKSSR